MKRAFVDRILLGFVLFMISVFFLATLFDEQKVKNDITNLKTLALDTTNTLASLYIKGVKNENKTFKEAICSAQKLAKKLAQKSPFPNNAYAVEWRSSDSSSLPTTVTVKTAPYKSDVFWYRFLNKKSFDLKSVSYTADLTSFKKEKKFTFDSTPDAVQYNLVGIYESGERSDGTKCVEDNPKPQIVMVNKDNMNKGDILGGGSFSGNAKIFFITNGYQFGNFQYNPARNSSMSIEDTKVEFTNLCSANTSNRPIYTITDDDNNKYIRESGNNKRQNVIFEDKDLNIDGENHTHKIKKEEHNNYLYFVEDTKEMSTDEEEIAKQWREDNINGRKCDTTIVRDKSCFDQWEELASDSSNNISKEEDVGNEYITITENISSQKNLNASQYSYDADFSDMSFGVSISYTYIQKKEITQADTIINSFTCPP